MPGPGTKTRHADDTTVMSLGLLRAVTPVSNVLLFSVCKPHTPFVQSILQYLIFLMVGPPSNTLSVMHPMVGPLLTLLGGIQAAELCLGRCLRTSHQPWM